MVAEGGETERAVTSFAVTVRFANESNAVELYRRGVSGVIQRSISPNLLPKCVRKIAAGEIWIDNRSVNRMIEAYRLDTTALDSPRTP